MFAFRFGWRCCHGSAGTGESEVRTSCMAERARFGDGRGRVQEENCVGPGGADVLSAGAQGSRAGEGKALDHCR